VRLPSWLDRALEWVSLDVAEQEAKQPLAEAARPLARAARRRADMADQLATDASSRVAAWPVYREALDVAREARRAAKLDALAEDEVDAQLASPLEGVTGPEARDLCERASARVLATIAGIPLRTVRELQWERAVRTITVSAAIGLLGYAGWYAVKGPRNLARGCTVISTVQPAMTPSPLVNGILEEKTWALTNYEANAQVVIDLGALHRVDKIIVYGRGDREHAEFLPLVVEVSRDGVAYMELGKKEDHFTTYVPWIIARRIRDVRYVRLRKVSGSGRVALAEVEVLGR
jgi:F5/8 type C domain